MIVLINPKYPHNVGASVRAASCFGTSSVWFTGHRVSLKSEGKITRLPREERMRGYNDVELRHIPSRVYDHIPVEYVPVAVEITDGAETLPLFEHPKNAAYVFGPEDGGLDKVDKGLCQRFVRIPTAHCVNLSAAVYLTLYDRFAKSQVEGWPSRQSLGILDDDTWLMDKLGLT